MGYSARSLCARTRVSAVPRKCDSRVSSRGGRVLAHRGDLHDSADRRCSGWGASRSRTRAGRAARTPPRGRARGETVPIEDDDVDIAEFGRRSFAAASSYCRRYSPRVATGDPGDPQPTEGATWAGHFEDDDYVRVDWSQSARASSCLAPDLRSLRPRRTRRRAGWRADRAAADAPHRPRQRCSRRVECRDGPIWVVASRPA